MAKDYHAYKMFIGESEIAALVAVFFEGGKLTTDFLHFGGDETYLAYLTDMSYQIPEHYKLVRTFEPSWFTIYDDHGLTVHSYLAAPMRVYRAGDYSCIFQFESEGNFLQMLKKAGYEVT